MSKKPLFSAKTIREHDTKVKQRTQKNKELNDIAKNDLRIQREMRLETDKFVDTTRLKQMEFIRDHVFTNPEHPALEHYKEVYRTLEILGNPRSVMDKYDISDYYENNSIIESKLVDSVELLLRKYKTIELAIDNKILSNPTQYADLIDEETGTVRNTFDPVKFMSVNPKVFTPECLIRICRLFETKEVFTENDYFFFTKLLTKLAR